MAEILVCDLCGKPLSGYGDTRLFKVKERKALWHEAWWETIDVHDECLKTLLEAVHERRNQNGSI